jgi:hypothetical protein
MHFRNYHNHVYTYMFIYVRWKNIHFFLSDSYEIYRNIVSKNIFELLCYKIQTNNLDIHTNKYFMMRNNFCSETCTFLQILSKNLIRPSSMTSTSAYL